MTGTKYLRKYFLVFTICTIWLTGCSQTHTRDTNYSYKQPANLNDSIFVDEIYKVNIDSNKIIELTKLILKDTFPNIHSLLICKDNKLMRITG